ncbi:hypothetical protein COLO4_04849 [Corchorus olitorius]|uniref:Uncharacterized protein n=1 Tax=Corchorus olitorius TaxID=93759 RepID=A0A1R3KSM9_9ROSI|nr:hypothetical protein COLO4_04849 [Corchorus olitorius]
MASGPATSSTISSSTSSTISNSTMNSSLGFSLSTTTATNFNHLVPVRLDRTNFLLWRLEQHSLVETTPITANIATRSPPSNGRSSRNQDHGRGNYNSSNSFRGRGRRRGRSTFQSGSNSNNLTGASTN